MEEIYLKAIEKNFGIVKKFQMIGNWREVYRVDLENSIIRVDILSSDDSTMECQIFGIKERIVCFPRIKEIIKLGDIWLKISEWIIGETYQHYWNSNTLTEEMLFKMGESIALMNKITQKGLHLHITDMHYKNVLWDMDNCCVMCDLDSLHWTEDDYINKRLIMLLFRKIKERNMIDAFIEGYKKHRDVRKLVSLCKE